MSDCVEEIYQSIALENNIPKEAVSIVINNLWSGIKDEIKTIRGRNILLPYFGSIYYDEYNLNREKRKSKYSISKLEEKWKNGELEWEKYLVSWKILNRALQVQTSLLDAIEKRKNRRKYDREF